MVVNEFVKTEKFRELFAMLQEAADRFGVHLRQRTGGELWMELAEAGYRRQNLATEPEFVLFWDKDVRLAGALEGMELKVYNSAQSIADCDDKAATFLKLTETGLRMPKTVISPKKFHGDGLIAEGFTERTGALLGYPCVFKECYGSFGQQVYLISSEEELRQRIRETGERGYLVQEYIESSCGRDIRLQVVGDRVIAGMYRYHDSDFRANITGGGKMKPYEATKAQEEMALRACRALGLTFGGVDILFGPLEEPILCEVNSNAHFKNLYDCTGINAADAILEECCRRSRS